jgi:hypothetical protein
MAKSIKEIVEESLKDLIDDGKIVVKDENGDPIEDLTIGFADEDDSEDQDDE